MKFPTVNAFLVVFGDDKIITWTEFEVDLPDEMKLEKWRICQARAKAEVERNEDINIRAMWAMVELGKAIPAEGFNSFYFE